MRLYRERTLYLVTGMAAAFSAGYIDTLPTRDPLDAMFIFIMALVAMLCAFVAGRTE